MQELVLLEMGLWAMKRSALPINTKSRVRVTGSCAFNLHLACVVPRHGLRWGSKLRYPESCYSALGGLA